MKDNGSNLILQIRGLFEHRQFIKSGRRKLILESGNGGGFLVRTKASKRTNNLSRTTRTRTSRTQATTKMKPPMTAILSSLRPLRPNWVPRIPTKWRMPSSRTCPKARPH